MSADKPVALQRRPRDRPVSSLPADTGLAYVAWASYSTSASRPSIVLVREEIILAEPTLILRQ